jgi:hypothetical protein
MKTLICFCMALIVASSVFAQEGGSGNPPLKEPRVKWQALPSLDLADFNKDLVAGKPTMDIGIYIPSNFDPLFNKLTTEGMLDGVRAAKEIFAPAGVQIRLLFAKTGEINPKYLSIQSNEIPGVPETEYANTYEHLRRHPSVLTAQAKAAFESIIEPQKDNPRTIYLIALQDVFYPFAEFASGRNWIVKSVRTGGLSFPGYSYSTTLPSRLRGVITICNLTGPMRSRRSIAHEIGHKVMNVSHEYMATDPGFEVFAEGGLMLYGNGEDIPSGQSGRWHLERLHLSPFLYRLNPDGSKNWNADYKESGHYYDPIYGDKVVNFAGKAKIDESW